MYGINISWSTEVLLLVWYKISYMRPNYIGDGNVSMQSVWQYKYYDQVNRQMCSAMWFLVISLSALHLQAKTLLSNYSVSLLPCLLIYTGHVSMRVLTHENKTRFISMMTHTYSFHQGFP